MKIFFEFFENWGLKRKTVYRRKQRIFFWDFLKIMSQRKTKIFFWIFENGVSKKDFSKEGNK